MITVVLLGVALAATAGFASRCASANRARKGAIRRLLDALDHGTDQEIQGCLFELEQTR